MAKKPVVMHEIPIAANRIEFGEVVDGKLHVTVFEAGDQVTLEGKQLDDLIKGGSVKIEQVRGVG
jgi:hypothetical protein